MANKYNTPVFPKRIPGGATMLVDRHTYPGSIFFVDSGAAGVGTTAGFGYSPDAPLSTIDAAIARCTADSGDVILVAPGHAETMGTFACDIAGIRIEGMGEYTGYFDTTKPTITFDTTTDEILVTAANVTLKNLRLVSGVNNLANFIDNDAANLLVEGCDFVTSSTFEAYNFINQATTVDFLTVRNCSILQPSDPEGTDAAAATGGIYCVDTEHILIEGCYFVGQPETGWVHNKTTACVDLFIRDSIMKIDLDSATHLEIVANATGFMKNTVGMNIAAADVAVANIVGATLAPNFFVSRDCDFGNDGAGGQLGAPGDAAAS